MLSKDEVVSYMENGYKLLNYASTGKYFLEKEGSTEEVEPRIVRSLTDAGVINRLFGLMGVTPYAINRKRRTV